MTVASLIEPWRTGGFNDLSGAVQDLLDEGVPLEDIDSEIYRRSPGRHVEFSAWTFGALTDYRARTHLEAPRTRGYPPRIFISYRRVGSIAVRRSVVLAEALEDAGYEVIWDGALEGEQEMTDLADFYAEIARSDIGLVLLESEYWDTDEEGMRLWLYEEFYGLYKMHRLGLLELVYVLCDGFAGFPLNYVDHSIAVLDARGDDLAPLVIGLLGEYKQLRFDHAEEDELGARAGSIIRACVRARPVEAELHVKALRGRYAGSEEFALAWAYYLWASGQIQSATQAALSLIRSNPSVPTVYLATKLLWLMDRDRAAFALASHLVFHTSLWQQSAVFIKGDASERVGLPLTAANHFRVLSHTKSELRQTGNRLVPVRLLMLLVESSHVGRDEIEQALQVLEDEDLVALAPDGNPARIEHLMGRARHRLRAPVNGPDAIVCDNCRSRYPTGTSVCLYCGTVHAHVDVDMPCPMCRVGDTIVTVETTLPFCPSCRMMFGPLEELFTRGRPGLFLGRGIAISGRNENSPHYVDLCPKLFAGRSYASPPYANDVDPRWWHRADQAR